MAPRQRAHLFGPRGNLREDQLKSYVDAGFAVVAVDFRLAPETKLGEILHEKWGRVENLFLIRSLGVIWTVSGLVFRHTFVCRRPMATG